MPPQGATNPATKNEPEEPARLRHTCGVGVPERTTIVRIPASAGGSHPAESVFDPALNRTDP
jgi:hypothetical protein